MAKMAQRRRSIKQVPESVTKAHVKEATAPTPVTANPKPATDEPKLTPSKKGEVKGEKTQTQTLDLRFSQDEKDKLESAARAYNMTFEKVAKRLGAKLFSQMRDKFNADLASAPVTSKTVIASVPYVINITQTQFEAIREVVDPLDLNTKKENVSILFDRLISSHLQKS